MKSSKSRGARKALFLTLTVAFLAGCAFAQKSDPCSQQEYKILSPSAIAIRCIDEASALGIQGGTGTLIFQDANYTKADAKISVLRGSWLLVRLSGASPSLQPGKKYKLWLTFSICPKGCTTGQPTTTNPVLIEIDTTESLTISPSVVDSEPNAFKAKSSVGFSVSGHSLSYLSRTPNAQGAPVRDTQACTISVLNGANHVLPIKAKCSKLNSISSDSPNDGDWTLIDPDDVGVYDITLDKAYESPLIPGPLKLKTVFGNTPRVDLKSRFSPKKAPTTKDASQYYVNFNWAAGVGAVPAWVIDSQIAPQLWMVHGFTLGPTASASVGNNKIAGQTYTDSIDLGLTSQKPFFFREHPYLGLGELLLRSGINYETNKEFDRDNLTANADLRWNFAGLYHTHVVAALQAYYRAVHQHENPTKGAGAEVSASYAPQIDDFHPPKLGYSLDFHTGIETGGALVDTTVHASTGKATQVLPTYAILRLVPQVHGVLELCKLTFDATLAGRYLALSENTVRQTQANALILDKVQGWKGIGTLTTTYTLDPQGHVALTIKYTDGFAPPNYKRVNAVQAGILVKY